MSVPVSSSGVLPPPLLLRTSSSFLTNSSSASASAAVSASGTSTANTPNATPSIPSSHSSSSGTAAAASVPVSSAVSPSPSFSSVPLLPTCHPPPHFSCVAPTIYRSLLFDATSLPFLDTLKLRSILFLTPTILPGFITDWAHKHSITLHFPSSRSQSKQDSQSHSTSSSPLTSAFTDYYPALIRSNLEFILSRSNSPVLICAHPREYAALAVLIGCLRRLQYWSFSLILEEYERFMADFPGLQSLLSHIHTHSHTHSHSSSSSSSSSVNSLSFANSYTNPLCIELFDRDSVTLKPEDTSEWFIEHRQLYQREKQWIEREGSESQMDEESIAFNKLGLKASQWRLVQQGTKFDKKLSLVDEDDDDD